MTNTESIIHWTLTFQNGRIYKWDLSYPNRWEYIWEFKYGLPHWRWGIKYYNWKIVK